jgi:hypothetical protein
LPLEALRAELSIIRVPSEIRAQKKAVISVRIKNISAVTWPARERGGSPHQVSVGNHWLDAAGKVLINDDGRSALLQNLAPGETTELSLTVNAPAGPGRYLLEIDMLQEGVSWFGLAGSRTIRLPVDIR